MSTDEFTSSDLFDVSELATEAARSLSVLADLRHLCEVAIDPNAAASWGSDARNHADATARALHNLRLGCAALTNGLDVSEASIGEAGLINEVKSLAIAALARVEGEAAKGWERAAVIRYKAAILRRWSNDRKAAK